MTYEVFSPATYDVPSLVCSCLPPSSAKFRINITACSQQWHYIVASWSYYCTASAFLLSSRRKSNICPPSANFISLSHSLIHSDISIAPRALLLRGASDTARVLCRNFTPKRHRQLRVKDLPKVPMWRLERDSSPRPSGWNVSTQPMRHQAPLVPP